MFGFVHHAMYMSVLVPSCHDQCPPHLLSLSKQTVQLLSEFQVVAKQIDGLSVWFIIRFCTWNIAEAYACTVYLADITFGRLATPSPIVYLSRKSACVQ
jgi:hypothetical protein